MKINYGTRSKEYLAFIEWIKQFICVFICVITLASPVIEVQAATKYVSSSTSGDNEYYIVEGQDVNKLFDFSISDVPNILNWILDFKTYTVIKKYKDNGKTVYKGCFNTPNLQSLVKNFVISMIDDGYTDNTYDVNQTENIVKVGDNATSKNAITRYGFKIPNYKYMGEFPKEIMSPANIIPDTNNFWDWLWRAVCAIFGVSFLKAPDADNYNTITYMNHKYADSSNFVLNYFKKYYLKYFESKIPVGDAWDDDKHELKSYFNDPEHVHALTVNEEAKDAAEDYIEKYMDEYVSALQHMIWWEKYKSTATNPTTLTGKDITKVKPDGSWLTESFKKSLNDVERNKLANGDKIYDEAEDIGKLFKNKWTLLSNNDGNVYISKQTYGTSKDRVVDGWHFLASRDIYTDNFINWLEDSTNGSDNANTMAVLIDSIPNSVKRYKYYSDSTDTRFIIPVYSPDTIDGHTDYGITGDVGSYEFSDAGEDNINAICIAADIIKYSYNYVMAHFIYDVQEQIQKVTNTKKNTTYKYYTEFKEIRVRYYPEGPAKENGTKYTYYKCKDNNHTIKDTVTGPDNNTSYVGTDNKNEAYYYYTSPITNTIVEGIYIKKNEWQTIKDNNKSFNDQIRFVYNRNNNTTDTGTWTNDPVPAMNPNGSWTTVSNKRDLPQDNLYADVTGWINNTSSHYETLESNPPTVSGTENGPTKNIDESYTNTFTIDKNYLKNSNNTNYTMNGLLNYSSINRKIYLDPNSSHHNDFRYDYEINAGKIISYEKKEVNEYTREDSKTYTRKGNYRFKGLWSGSSRYPAGYDDANTPKIEAVNGKEKKYKDFRNSWDFTYKNLKFKHIDERTGELENTPSEFTEEDFVHPDLKSVYNNFEKNMAVIAQYKTFTAYMNRGNYSNNSSEEHNYENAKYIPYKQCLITNTGSEGECKSDEYGDDETTITAANAVVYSGVYKITDKYRSNRYSGRYSTLTDEDAFSVIAAIKEYCGPYYTQVLSNMMKMMAYTAKNQQPNSDTGPELDMVKDDLRVMPYDTTSMIKKDKENYSVVDPRVSIYKSHIIGGIVSDFQINILGIFFYIRPQEAIISAAGAVTEVSVFLQSICNFDVFDDLGLSPKDMWSSGYAFLFTAAVLLFFIIKTIIAVIKMGTKSIGKVLAAFLILVLELGVATLLTTNPDSTWSTLKNMNEKVMSLGEQTSVLATDPSLSYLFGDSDDTEVLYYLPYIDTWARYNTGYGLLKDEQKINAATDKQELNGFDNSKYQIGSQNINHYCILLADAFEYHGRSESVLTGVQDSSGKIMNGSTINNNAYRVVDHFLAPQITLTESNGITLTAKQNPNYNGEFQNTFFDLIVKFANCLLCCFLSVIKLMIFIFYWWQLYAFIFNVVLGMGEKGKKMSQIVLETFMPLFALIVFGAYAATCIMIGMTVEGFIGLCIILFMFFLTIVLIRWWKHYDGGVFFPFTLGWIYTVTSISAAYRRRQVEKLKNESETNSTQAGIHFESPEDKEKYLQDPAYRTNKLFDENGNMRSEYVLKYKQDADGDGAGNMQKEYDLWYKYMLNLRKSGIEPSNEQMRSAIRNYEQNNLTKDHAASVRDEVRNSRRGKVNNNSKTNKKSSTGKIDKNSSNNKKSK